MKLKYYLRGLGIGIFITTLIFMIGMKVNEEKLVSDKEIISRAKELGMVMGESKSEPKTLEELEAEQKKMNEQKQAEQEPQQPQQPQENQQAEGQKEEEKKTEKIEQVEISILPGEYSAAISQKLLDAGLIADKDEFNRYLNDTDSDNFIQPGTFTIPKGSNFDEIVKILVTKQENR